jgi:predicted ATPase
LLLRRWSKAKTGEGQVALLSGEAGIGKSRLTAALLDRLTNEPHSRLRYFCSPQHTDSALYPVIGQTERAAGFVHDDTAQAKLEKLDAVLAQTSTRIEQAGLFAEMLSLKNDGRYPALDLPPGAAPTENARSAHFTSRGADTQQSGADGLRGCPLERPYELGSAWSDS